jgi:hypothetical protein
MNQEERVRLAVSHTIETAKVRRTLATRSIPESTDFCIKMSEKCKQIFYLEILVFWIRIRATSDKEDSYRARKPGLKVMHWNVHLLSRKVFAQEQGTFRGCKARFKGLTRIPYRGCTQ